MILYCVSCIYDPGISASSASFVTSFFQFLFKILSEYSEVSRAQHRSLPSGPCLLITTLQKSFNHLFIYFKPFLLIPQ